METGVSNAACDFFWRVGKAIYDMSLIRGLRSGAGRVIVWMFVFFEASVFLVSANNSIHTTYLWHVHQPIYWPDRRNFGTDHYEAAWDTIQQQDGGRLHPNPEILRNIFGIDDRKAAYQSRLNDSLESILWLPKAGVQVSYSGALMENVQSLGNAGQLGYGSGWNLPNREARGWTTSGGKPRMDLVNFTYHHALGPLLSDETLEMELRIHQRHMDILWGTSPAHSRGYFPTETCFSERMIPILKKVGIDWSIVANSHLSRTCADFPYVAGSGGENCDIPNKADQLNPAQGSGNYKRITIDRGISPAAAMPFAYQPRYARYVDPTTGVESKVVIVPSDQALGWKDSYSSWDLGLMDDLNARNNPGKPALVMFAHDGDNAWSGGYSYYMEWVNNFNTQANGHGYEPTTVEQYLQDHPIDSNDVVHIEDGGWVYADSDFGSPIMINWHWPPSYSANGVNVVDPSIGISDKADNWRVIIATENRVKTAQQIGGVMPNIDQVRDPGSFGGTPNGVELGWHYYLGSLDSGFVYYGCHDDECQRAKVAQDNAVGNVNPVINANPSADTTPPTVFIPQRHPWNPGGQNFGVQYSYKVTNAANTDFFVWTYAYDVSGLTNVNLKFRLNGANPPTQDQFQTYAGGFDTGPWITSNMTQRVVAPVIGVTPQYIADYYWTKVTGVADSYADYYVEATDARGNNYKSPIQHVYVSPVPTGGGGGSTNGCNGRVCVSPAPPVAANPVTISFDPSGGPLSGAGAVKIHLGWNNWATVLADASMTFDAASNRWEYTTTIDPSATQLDCVFNNGAGTWDNNGGADWHFAVAGGTPPQTPPTPTGVTAAAVSSNQINVSWMATSNTVSYVVFRGGTRIAATTATTYDDLNLTASTLYCYTVVASNSAGASAQSVQACATTLSGPLPQPPPTPSNISATGVSTNQISVAWFAASGATSYIVARGGSPIAIVSTTSYLDGGLLANSQYCYSIAASNSAGASTFSSPVCGTTLALPPPSFVLNGSVSNYPGYLLTSPGMTLYAAVRGTTLYVATWSPGTNGPNDHFILVSDQILASPATAAPWAKAGTIAIPATKVMLTGESQGTYFGWQNLNGSTATASNQAIKASSSTGQLQGTINLTQAFGSMPSTLYLCAAAYTTANGGALAWQAPAGNLDGNIDSNEFLAVPVASIADSNGDGLLDNLDPSMGFVVQNAQSSGSSGFTITWVAVPGKSYQVMCCDSLGAGWTNLPNAQVTADSGQVSLSYTDTSATNASQRFYNIHSQ